MLRLTILALGLVLTLACGDDANPLLGKWKVEGNMPCGTLDPIEFKRDMVVMPSPRGASQVEYEIDGDQVNVKAMDGSVTIVEMDSSENARITVPAKCSLVRLE